MKKIVTMLLVVVMVLGLFAGCGTKTADETKAPTAAATAAPVSYTHLTLPTNSRV